MSTPTLLLLVAVVAVFVYFFFVPHSGRVPTNLVQSPSNQTGTFNDKSRFEQKFLVTAAENEAKAAQATRDATAAIHEQHNIDKADELGIPREAFTAIVIGDHAHSQAIDLLEQQARIEVSKEAEMVAVWLTAARSAILAPYFNAEEVRGILAKILKERARLRQLVDPDEAAQHMLALLDATVPILDGDYRARIRQIALQAGSRPELRGPDEDSDGTTDSANSSEAESEPISSSNPGVGKRRPGDVS